MPRGTGSGHVCDGDGASGWSALELGDSVKQMPSPGQVGGAPTDQLALPHRLNGTLLAGSAVIQQTFIAHL